MQVSSTTLNAFLPLSLSVSHRVFTALYVIVLFARTSCDGTHRHERGRRETERDRRFFCFFVTIATREDLQTAFSPPPPRLRSMHAHCAAPNDVLLAFLLKNKLSGSRLPPAAFARESSGFSVFFPIATHEPNHTILFALVLEKRPFPVTMRREKPRAVPSASARPS